MKLRYIVRLDHRINEDALALLKSLHLVTEGSDKLETIEITVYPAKIQISTNLGITHEYDIVTGIVSMQVREREPVALSYDKLRHTVDRLQKQPNTVKQYKTSRTYDFPSGKSSLHRYNITTNEFIFDCWTAPGIVMDKLSQFVWHLWFGNVSSQINGIPVDMIIRDPDDPDNYLLYLKLDKIGDFKPGMTDYRKRQLSEEKLHLTQINKIDPDTLENMVVKYIEGVVSDQKRPMEQEIPDKKERPNRSLLFHSHNADAMQHIENNAFGVAYRDGFLQEQQDTINRVFQRIGLPFAQRYEATDTEVNFSLNLRDRYWPQINFGLPIQQTTVEYLLIISRLLGTQEEGTKNFPVRADEMEGGLQDVWGDFEVVPENVPVDEWRMWQIITQILDLFTFNPNGYWEPDFANYPQGRSRNESRAIDEIFIEIWILLTLFDNEIERLDNLQSQATGQVTNQLRNSIPRDLQKDLLYLLLFGFVTEFDVFLGAVFLLDNLRNRIDQTVLPSTGQSIKILGNNVRRAQAFADAQLTSVLTIDIPISDATPFTSIFAGIRMNLTLPALLWLELNGDIIQNLRHEDFLIKLDLVVPRIMASLDVDFSIAELGAAIAVLGGYYGGIIGLIGAGFLIAYIEGASGTVTINLEDFSLPLNIDLSVTDDSGVIGYGFDISLDGTWNCNPGEGEEFAAPDFITWQNEGDDDLVASLPWPINEIVFAFRGTIYNELRCQLANGLQQAFRDMSDDQIFPWTSILKLFRAPNHRMLDLSNADDENKEAFHYPEAIWGRLNNLNLPGIGDEAGEIVIEDINNLGYIFSAKMIASWLNSYLSSISSVLNLTWGNARNWWNDSGVNLPNIFSYDDPPAEADLITALATHILVEEGGTRTLDEIITDLCGNPPSLNPDRRFHHMRMTRTAPRIELSPDGRSDGKFGDCILQFDIVFNAILRRQIARAELKEGSALLPQNSNEDEEMYAPGTLPGHWEDDDADGHSGPDPWDEEWGEDHPGISTVLDSLSSSSSSYGGAQEVECYWTVETKEYILEEILVASVEIKLGMLLGFLEREGGMSLNNILTSMMPELALDLAKGTDGQGDIAVEVTSLSMSEQFSDADQDQMRAHLVSYIRSYMQGFLDTAFDPIELSGLSYLISNIDGGLITSQLPDPIRFIRLIQEIDRDAIEDGAEWDNGTHTFTYFIRHGHVIWPVHFEFDINELLP